MRRLKKATMSWDESRGLSHHRSARRLIAVLVVPARAAMAAINPFRRKGPARGLVGVGNLLILLLTLAAVSGYVTHITGLREATLHLLSLAEGLLQDTLRGLFLGRYQGLADALASLGRVVVLGLAILALVTWILNLGNFTEAAILGILATYQGKVITSLVEVSITFALPITLTWLLLSIDRATCLILLGFLAVQLIYLRWNIDAHLARQYLARIVAVRGGLSSLDLDSDSDDAS